MLKKSEKKFRWLRSFRVVEKPPPWCSRWKVCGYLPHPDTGHPFPS